MRNRNSGRGRLATIATNASGVRASLKYIAILLAVLAPRIPRDAARATIIAAHLHDAGKAHPVWQDALCALAGESEAAAVEAAAEAFPMFQELSV